MYIYIYRYTVYDPFFWFKMCSRFILPWNDVILTFIYFVVVSREFLKTPAAVTCSFCDVCLALILNNPSQALAHSIIEL